MVPQRQAAADAFVVSAKKGHEVTPMVARDMTEAEAHDLQTRENLQSAGIGDSTRKRGKGKKSRVAKKPDADAPKAEAKSDAKPAAKPVRHANAKPDGSAAKPAAKPAGKPAAATGDKPAAKPAGKPKAAAKPKGEGKPAG